MLTLSVSECDLILLEAGRDLQQAEADLVIWRPCGEGAGLLRLCLPDISLRDRAWRMWCRESSHGSTTDSRLVLKWKVSSSGISPRLYLRDVARRKEGLACITGDVSPEGDSTLSIGRRGDGTWGDGSRLLHPVDLLVLLTFSMIQLVTMSQPWGPWILA